MEGLRSSHRHGLPGSAFRMTSHQTSPENSRMRRVLPITIKAGVLTGVVAVIVYLFHYHGVTDVGYMAHHTTQSAFNWLWGRWMTDWYTSGYAYSHWVPLVSAWLLWCDRHALARQPRRTAWWALGIVLFSLFLHWAGTKAEQTRITLTGLIGLSWGIPFFLCGWAMARRLLFPCAFLLFSLPLNFLDALIYPLRMFSAKTTVWLVTGLGLDVERSGSVIHNTVGALTHELATAGTDVFAAGAVMAIAFLAAHLINGGFGRRVLIVIIAWPLWVVINILTGTCLTLLGATLSLSSEGDGIQSAAGFVVFLLTVGGIAGLAFRLHQPRPEANEIIASSFPAASATLLPWASLLLLMLGAAAWIPKNLATHHLEEPGINLYLPLTLGAWEGDVVLFCHNPDHPGPVTSTDLQPGSPCPVCGHPLQGMTALEQSLLPADTTVIKSIYHHERERVHFSIVLSGRKRSSIHRPEVCLVGPDSEIEHSYIHRFDLGTTPIKLRILEMVQRDRLPDGRTVSINTYYAYWFAGAGRETPYHMQRMFWMAYDRIFKNLSSPWAYISISGHRHPGDRQYLEEIKAFLIEAYPALHAGSDS